MERKIALWILGITLLALALAILLPGGRTVTEDPRLPWLITVDDAGYPTVFGITLGKTPLQSVRDGFREQGEINLFVSPEGKYSIEVYFEKLYLSGIRGAMIVSLKVAQEPLEQMYQRGLRISKLESGARKVKLTKPDEETLAGYLIDHIAYIPKADLDETLIVNRFGEPARQIPEKSGIVHWLYPDKGLDIALNPDGKEVFQYVVPSNFDQILSPLEQGLD